MIKENKYTPEHISSLNRNEIFVFGSNLAGLHQGGAARVAVQKFGAVMGQGVGLQGQSYAIPTMQGGVETIRPYVDDFIKFASQHTDLTFYVTRIGCGIAGFKDEEIAPLFKDAIELDNVILPESFFKIITCKFSSRNRIRDKVRGSLMAGAAGDALGYAVEFMSLNKIRKKYGINGIRTFECDSNGKALISDDTQMTLFTVNGMLMGLTRGCMRGIGGRPEKYVDVAYLDWYYTQTHRKQKNEDEDYPYTWLRDLPQMHHGRAPGITCMNACESLLERKPVKNDSKGCGGLMRVAPMGLLAAAYEEVQNSKFPYDEEELMIAGAEIAEVTHKHPLGFLPAALLTYLLYKIIPLTPREIENQIYKIIEDGLELLNKIYKGEYEQEKSYLTRLTHEAIKLAKEDITDESAIRKLGEGWVAEEAWAIALYCSLKHFDNVAEAIVAAVNHDGDSDSTGSICGNIMGAIYGYEKIRKERLFCPNEKTFESTLELHNIILALADDLFSGCIISQYDCQDTPEKRQWFERYCEMKPAGIEE